MTCYFFLNQFKIKSQLLKMSQVGWGKVLIIKESVSLCKVQWSITFCFCHIELLSTGVSKKPGPSVERALKRNKHEHGNIRGAVRHLSLGKLLHRARICYLFGKTLQYILLHFVTLFRTNLVFLVVCHILGVVKTKAMRSVKRYACYANTAEFCVIPTSVINVRILLRLRLT